MKPGRGNDVRSSLLFEHESEPEGEVGAVRRSEGRSRALVGRG